MKIENKNNKSSMRTKKIIADALISLMNLQSFNSISIIDICDKALVSRTTFYVYFQDKYDLLAYITKNISEEFQIAEGNISEHHKKLFKAAKKYNKFFSNLGAKGPNSAHSVSKQEVIKRLFDAAELTNPPLSAQIAILAMASASEGILEWWLEQNNHSDIDVLYNEMLNIFNWDYINQIMKANHS